MQFCDDIRLALSGLTGDLPRRAAVCDSGNIVDKVAHPHRREVPVVSLVCEILRRARNEPVYPRPTHTLLELCAATNEAGAWRALVDDAATGDMDAGVVSSFWHVGNVASLVQSLVVAGSGMHAWLVIRAIQHMLPLMDAPTTRELGTAFHRLFPDVVKSLSRRTLDISADMRAAAITSLGKLIVWCDIPPVDLCGMLRVTLANAPDDVMRLFHFAPMAGMLVHDAELVEAVLRRAERAAHSSRYSAVALLAIVPPDQLSPFAERLAVLVQRTLDTSAAQGNIDPRMALVCGVLAKVVAPPRSMHASLAHALCCMSIKPAAHP